MATSQDVQMETRHVAVIEAIAKETNRPIGEVTELYTAEISRLQSDARIRDFLVVLASKKVRDVLRHPH